MCRLTAILQMYRNCGPIEKFWALLKKSDYDSGWTCDTHEELIARIKFCLGKMPRDISQNLMRGVWTKVRKAADRGVLSVIN